MAGDNSVNGTSYPAGTVLGPDKKPVPGNGRVLPSEVSHSIYVNNSTPDSASGSNYAPGTVFDSATGAPLKSPEDAWKMDNYSVTNKKIENYLKSKEDNNTEKTPSGNVTPTETETETPAPTPTPTPTPDDNTGSHFNWWFIHF